MITETVPGGHPAHQNDPVPTDAPEVSRRTPTTLAVVGVLVALGLAILAWSVWLDAEADPDGVGADLATGWGTTYTLLGAVMSILAAVILVRFPRQGFVFALDFTV